MFATTTSKEPLPTASALPTKNGATFSEPEPAWRRGLGAPRRHDEEFLAGQHRRPRVLSCPYPVYIGRPARLAKPHCAFRVHKERLHEPVTFDDAQRSSFPQIREQTIAA